MASQDDSENLVANAIGSMAYSYIVNSLSVGLCYGISICLFYASFHVLSLHKERPARSRRTLLALIVFMFLMNTGLFISCISQTLIQFHWAGDTITDNTPSLEDRLLAANRAAIPYAICATLIHIMNFIIGDSITLWHATALWPHSYWIKGGLYFLFLGDIGVGLYELVNLSTVEIHGGGTLSGSVFSIDAVRILVSMVVNLMATLCIAVKAWQFRNSLRLAFSRSATKKSLVNQVLTFLAKSGTIFCTFQVLCAVYELVLDPKVDIIGYTPMDPINIFAAATRPFEPFIAGMYPSFIVLILEKQQSVFAATTFIACSENDPAAHVSQQQARALSTLQFASTQESVSLQSQLISSGGNFRQSVKDRVPHVTFSPDAQNTV